MCVLAGYIGDGPAAPILLEMIRKMEGLGGGYYTGVATIDEGEMHYRKVVGDVATLLAETDAARLPGTLGIAHSRTKSGGDHEWAHPFVDGARRLAYVANGCTGVFADTTRRVAAGDALLRAGHCFLSATQEAIGSYPVLSDGSCVHMSDVMCAQIAHRLGETGDLSAAMARAFVDIPSEIVGLAVHADHPDRFAAARFNMPLVIGGDETATWAATTALSFPGAPRWRLPMPGNCAATIRRDHVELRPFADPPLPVAPMPSPQALCETVVAALEGGEPRTLGALCEATTDLWPPDMLAQKAMAVYETLVGLLREGRVSLAERRVPGADEQKTAPQTVVRQAHIPPPAR